MNVNLAIRHLPSHHPTRAQSRHTHFQTKRLLEILHARTIENLVSSLDLDRIAVFVRKIEAVFNIFCAFIVLTHLSGIYQVALIRHRFAVTKFSECVERTRHHSIVFRMRNDNEQMESRDFGDRFLGEPIPSIAKLLPLLLQVTRKFRIVKILIFDIDVFPCVAAGLKIQLLNTLLALVRLSPHDLHSLSYILWQRWNPRRQFCQFLRLPQCGGEHVPASLEILVQMFECRPYHPASVIL
ncbi:hypothetical protein HMPREF3115_02770 [Burkholderia sp. HMSC10F09]|nr:hypothetical protein HMPREF3115_02770 [Burkholderia sp. HMSC10F09]